MISEEIITISVTSLGTTNKLTIEVQQCNEKEYSIIAYDELGDEWKELFAENFEDSKMQAAKLLTDILEKYEK